MISAWKSPSPVRIIPANSAPQTRPRASYRYGGGRVERAKEAAIDKALSRAFRLNCGHFTYIDIQLAYAVWRPRSNKLGRFYYCETCSDWVHLPPKPKAPPRQDTPLF